MGQAVKYAILAVGLIAIIAAGVGIYSQFSDLSSGFGSSVASFINSLSSALRNVKGCINYLLGGGVYVNIFNAILLTDLLLSVLLVPVQITVTCLRWANQ